MGNARSRSAAQKQQLKTADGVRVRSQSGIQIDFYFRGVRCRETVKLKPTPRNLGFAAKLKARIEHEIGTGQFDYARHFPDSPRAHTVGLQSPGGALNVGEYLTAWLAAERTRI